MTVKKVLLQFQKYVSPILSVSFVQGIYVVSLTTVV